MKSRFHGWVREMWSGRAGVSGALVRTLLWPVEALFRGGVAMRAWFYDRGVLPSRSASIPVVSVGNLSVGGTGKTPVSSWVIRRLAEEGERPALVARGYGEDELLLHGTWTPGVPVVASPDRYQGVREAARRGASVAVLDDGFQHRRLNREVDLVLISAEEGVPGSLLPRGPFREPLGALGRADGVVVTRKSTSAAAAAGIATRLVENFPGLPVAVLHLAPGALRPLHPTPGGQEAVTAADGEGVLVATGVARPDSVVEAVRSLGREVAELAAFPDHHAFTADDVETLRRKAGGRVMVITEKDAVKFRALPGTEEGILVLGQELVWEEGEAGIRALLRRVAGRET